MSGRVHMIAHRGLSGRETENTNLAFTAAGNRAAFYGIETDVHRTSDGKYVVIHDSRTGRVSDEDLDVEASTFEELRAIRLRDKDGSSTRVDVRIPTLEEYIRICARYGKKAVLELKTPFSPGEVAEIVEIIRELGWLSETIFISFHREDMTALRDILPEQPAQFLTCEWNADVKDFVVANRLDIDIDRAGLTEEAMAEMKALGIAVNIWTVDDPEEAAKFAKWGADFITSNILETC